MRADQARTVGELDHVRIRERGVAAGREVSLGLDAGQPGGPGHIGEATGSWAVRRRLRRLGCRGVGSSPDDGDAAEDLVGTEEFQDHVLACTGVTRIRTCPVLGLQRRHRQIGEGRADA